MRFGVCIPGKAPLNQIIAQVKLAESLGYASAWIVDSQLLCRELYVSLTACALSTSRIRIGSGITAPRPRHLSVAASAFATLHEIAQGRLVMGVGTGLSLVRAIGKKPSTIREMENYVARLQRLLNGESVVFEEGVEGKISWLDGPTDIPIYVAASGPKMTRAAAKMSHHVMLYREITEHSLKAALNQVREGTTEAGKPLTEMDLVLYIPVSLSSDGALAREHIQHPVATMMRRADPNSFDPEDMPLLRELMDGYGYVSHTAFNVRPTKRIPEKYIDKFSLAGTPEQAREKVKALANMEAISEIDLSLQPSNGRFPSIESVMKDFAEGVMPYVS